MIFNTLAGTPPYSTCWLIICYHGITAYIAPTPMVTPDNIATRSPIKTLLPILTDPLVVSLRFAGGIESWSIFESPWE